jgi:hypothetical protein
MVKTSFLRATVDTCVSDVRARSVEKCATITRIRKCTENRAFNIKISSKIPYATASKVYRYILNGSMRRAQWKSVDNYVSFSRAFTSVASVTILSNMCRCCEQGHFNGLSLQKLKTKKIKSAKLNCKQLYLIISIEKIYGLQGQYVR